MMLMLLWSRSIFKQESHHSILGTLIVSCSYKCISNNLDKNTFKVDLNILARIDTDSEINKRCKGTEKG